MGGGHGHAARAAHAVSHEQGAEQPGALAVSVGAQDRHGAGADVSQLAGQLKPALESVTIILPCRNESGRIAACLDSLLGFTDLEAVNWEIWVFDGQSDDDTASLVREVVEQETRVKYFLNEQFFEKNYRKKNLQKIKRTHKYLQHIQR